MDKAHEVGRVSFSGTRMRLSVDGAEYEVDIARLSRKLAEASQAERENVVVSPAGYGVRWPDLDEDLSVDGLVGVEHKCPLARDRER
jgi:hypothetical protein